MCNDIPVLYSVTHQSRSQCSSSQHLHACISLKPFMCQQFLMTDSCRCTALALRCMTVHCLALRTGAKPRCSTHIPRLLAKPCTLVHVRTSARYTIQTVHAWGLDVWVSLSSMIRELHTVSAQVQYMPIAAGYAAKHLAHSKR